MKLFALDAKDGPDGPSIRLAKKEQHRAHLGTGGIGVRVMQSGPLLDEEGRRGSLIVFEAQSLERSNALSKPTRMFAQCFSRDDH